MTTLVGTVIGETSTREFSFQAKRGTTRMGEIVTVETGKGEEEGPQAGGVVWARVVGLSRQNPFLPKEAALELAEEELKLTDTVLSVTRDQVIAEALVLGLTHPNEPRRLQPLAYPVPPGAQVLRPAKQSVETVLIGEETGEQRILLGKLLGRSEIEAKVKANAILARHMAILAMTGGGKTVAVRRVLRELAALQYPVLVLDPHGDYLGLQQKADVLGIEVKLWHPHVRVNGETIDRIGWMIEEMTDGLSEPQKEVYEDVLDDLSSTKQTQSPKWSENAATFIDDLRAGLKSKEGKYSGHRGTIPAIRRKLSQVKARLDAMAQANERLRNSMQGKVKFEPLPDPRTSANEIVRPGRFSIVYLGGYEHLTQSTIAASLLGELFDHRATLDDQIPPFLSVLEEAHNLVPSRGEGQAETPSLSVIRRVATEGRKFGTGLLLVSQRPSRLDETALSQCNTFLVFRIVNPKDQQFVERVMENLGEEDRRSLAGLGPGQGIVSGAAVRFPLAIEVQFDEELVPEDLSSEDFLDLAKKWEEQHMRDVERNDAAIQAIEGA
jgi:DNA helicase HerA-like ATPase